MTTISRKQIQTNTRDQKFDALHFSLIAGRTIAQLDTSNVVLGDSKLKPETVNPCAADAGPETLCGEYNAKRAHIEASAKNVKQKLAAFKTANPEEEYPLAGFYKTIANDQTISQEEKNISSTLTFLENGKWIGYGLRKILIMGAAPEGNVNMEKVADELNSEWRQFQSTENIYAQIDKIVEAKLNSLDQYYSEKLNNRPEFIENGLLWG